MRHASPRTMSTARLAAAVRGGLADPQRGPHRRAAGADIVDGWLQQLWQDAWDGAGEDDSAGARGVALAAVGGHARRDSGPLGDLDLVLIHDRRAPPAALAEVADALWYPIWDNGFRLDHAVRSVSTCRDVAGRDMAAALGMLDLRPIAGDPQLTLRTRHLVRADWRSAARKRLQPLAETLRQRWERHGDLAHLLEGDLKQASGGLRDAVVVDALVATWLADAPHSGWQQARAYLLDVRDALHAVTGRPGERLVLAEQDAVAAALGHADADELLTRVCAAGHTIGYALKRTLTAAQASITVRRGLRTRSAPRLRAVQPGIAVHDGAVVPVPGVPATATLAVRLAAYAARTGLMLSDATAKRLAHECHPLVPGDGDSAGGATTPDAGEAVRPGSETGWSAPAREAFIELLAGQTLVAVWEVLDHAGLVSCWLPEWDAVRNRPQRNAVHRYTVDRHLVETCVQAAALRGDVARPDLLMLAALLHDIGKQAGSTDHSIQGAPIAATIATRMGFPPADVAVIRLLVAHHLTLVNLATRRDPDDPRTVAELVAAVDHDAHNLALLRSLTEADARAAGPAAWTAWRARLVDDLTTRARASLSGHPVPGPAPLGADEQELLARVRADSEPRVSVSETGDLQLITIVAPDRTGLFADIAGLLATHGLTVRGALIRTVDGIGVDTWSATGLRGAPDPAVLRTGLLRLAAGQTEVLDRLRRREAAYRPAGGVSLQPQVLLAPGASHQATVVEVRAVDRPGLLHALGSALRSTGVAIRSAHVATHAGRAVDVLYLAEADADPGQGALSPARTAEVIGLLSAAAEPPAGPQ